MMGLLFCGLIQNFSHRIHSNPQISFISSRCIFFYITIFSQYLTLLRMKVDITDFVGVGYTYGLFNISLMVID